MDILRKLEGSFKSKQIKFSFWSFVEFFGYFVSVCGLVFYLSGIISKYYFEPVINISEHQRQAQEIPFPAITFCSPVPLKSNLASVSEYYFTYKTRKTVPILSVDEQNFLAVKVQMCTLGHFNIFDEGTKYRTERNVVKLIRNGTLTVDESFAACYENYVLSKCNFIRSLTDLGLCYTFNTQTHESIFNPFVSSDFDSYKEKNYSQIWTLDGGYMSTNRSKIPYRSSLGDGHTFIMSVNESDTKDLCNTLKNSFKFIFHLPNEIPTVFHDSNYINFKTGLKIKITAVATRTDEDLKKYSPEKRRCYFEGERKLQFFKSYSKVHCNLECLTNFTLRRCGCVFFSYPRNDSTPVCDLDKVPCSKKAFIDWPDFDEMSNSTTLPCNCLPTCTMIQYKIKERQVQEMTENASVVIKEMAASRNVSTIFSSLTIEFGDFLITENENFVDYNLGNFIADCGGLLGLFLGFSFTAAIRFIRQLIESFKARETKVKDFDLKASKVSWVNDVDDRDDFMTLLWWQLQARKRANLHGFKKRNKLFKRSARVK